MTVSMKLNAEQFLMLGKDPPGTRLELVHGDILVSPSPSYSHSYTDTQLRVLLGVHIKKHSLGELVGDVDTVFDDANVRRPDIIFISNSRTGLRDAGKHGIRFAPDLCIEIVSPGSKEYDQVDKFALYAEYGVRHYWIVDPTLRTFVAYKLRKKAYAETASGRGDEVVKAEPFPRLKIPLHEIWPPSRER